MTKEEILEYIKHTPANSNIAVLSDMLEQYSSSNNSGGLYVTVNEETHTLNSTWQEINNALPFVVITDSQRGTMPVAYCEQEDGLYICVVMGESPIPFTTDSPDGYPTFTMYEDNSGNDDGTVS